MNVLAANLAHPSHVFWPDEISLCAALKPVQGRITGHQQITDAYLLGLAIHKRGRLATLDAAVPTLATASKRSRESVVLIK